MDFRPDGFFYDNEIIEAMNIVDLYSILFREELNEKQKMAFVEVYNTFIDELNERGVMIE